MDRTSELPESLIHHILSFLNAKEASRSCLLSKSWLRSLSTSPILDFDFNLDYYPDYPLIKHKLNKFLNAVERTVSNYSQLNLSLHKFRLHIQRVDSSFRYVLPQLSFASNSLIELSLFNCYFDKDIICRGNIEFSHLKKLEIGSLTLHDWMLHGLLSNCRLIEDIRLFHCDVTFKCVSFAMLPNLKSLTIEKCFSCPNLNPVQIKSPSLQSLIYSGSWLLNSFEGFQNLKKIIFSNWDAVFFKVTLSKLPLLEDLELWMCELLEGFICSSPSLKRVTVCCCSKLVQVKIDAPKLILFDYKGDGDTFPSISFVNTTETLKVHLFVSRKHANVVPSTWFRNLRKFLMSHSNQTEVLTLEILSEMKCFDINDFNQLPKPEVGKLILRLGSHSMMNKALLDGIFLEFPSQNLVR